jgi:hypothetical protein
MANGPDVQLELFDNKLGLNDHRLQTASVGLHFLRISSVSTLSTLRRTSSVLYPSQVVVMICWPAAYFGQFTRLVQSAHGIWPRKGMSSKVLYLQELRHYYLIQAKPGVIKL